MQVDLEPQNSTKVKRKARNILHRVLDALVPIAVVLIIGLYTYALAYRVVWKRVSADNRAASIALLTVFGFLIGLFFYEWILIHLYGPGKISKQYIKASDDDPFLCDPQGYALWCSECEHVRPNRAHHSSKLRRCVPVMDHYCIWIGSVIGQGNRKFFVMFSVALSIAYTYAFVLLLIFQHKPYPDTMPLSIALYILTGMLITFCYVITYSHFKLLFKCESTLDGVRFRKRDIHVNFPCPDNGRRVVNATQKGVTASALFSQGSWRNCTDVMGPVWTWFLPIRPTIYEPLMNDHVIERFQVESEEDFKNQGLLEEKEKSSPKENVSSSLRGSASLAPISEDDHV